MTPFYGNLPPDAIRTPFCSYQVRWQREDWQHPKTKTYETKAGAHKFIVRKLLGGDRPHLSRILFIEIWRRPVGHWEPHERVLP